MTKSRKDYKKELKVQTALGTLGRYRVFCPNAENNGRKYLLVKKKEPGKQWFLSCEIPNAVNAEHAIDEVMKQYDFPENAREYLRAERYE